LNPYILKSSVLQTTKWTITKSTAGISGTKNAVEWRQLPEKSVLSNEGKANKGKADFHPTPREKG
jgi:hypothetical protein